MTLKQCIRCHGRCGCVSSGYGRWSWTERCGLLRLLRALLLHLLRSLPHSRSCRRRRSSDRRACCDGRLRCCRCHFRCGCWRSSDGGAAHERQSAASRRSNRRRACLRLCCHRLRMRPHIGGCCGWRSRSRWAPLRRRTRWRMGLTRWRRLWSDSRWMQQRNGRRLVERCSCSYAYDVLWLLHVGCRR